MQQKKKNYKLDFHINGRIKNKSTDMQAWHAGEPVLIFYLWSKYGDHQLDDNPVGVSMSKVHTLQGLI